MTDHPAGSRDPVDDPMEALRPPVGVGEQPSASVSGRPAFDVRSAFGPQRPRSGRGGRSGPPVVTADIIDRIRPPADGGVVDLNRRRLPPWRGLAVAAAVLAMVVGAGALMMAGGGDDGQRVATDDDGDADRMITSSTDSAADTQPLRRSEFDAKVSPESGEHGQPSSSSADVLHATAPTTTPPSAPPTDLPAVADPQLPPAGTMSPMMAPAEAGERSTTSSPPTTIGTVMMPTVPPGTIESETTAPPSTSPTSTTTTRSTTTTTTSTTTTVPPSTTSAAPVAPVVTISHGSPANDPPDCSSDSCRFVAASLSNFEPNTPVDFDCYAEGDVFGSGTLTTDADGGFAGDLGCSYGLPGDQVWIVAAGVQSNSIVW